MNVEIIEPKNGAYTRHELPVEGVYADLPEGVDLWMVTVPETLQNYHPQGVPATLDDGDWRAMAYVGNARPNADPGARVKLLVVGATKEAGEVFRNYIADSVNRQQWLGMGRLPPGTEVITEIEVVRDDAKAPPVESFSDQSITFNESVSASDGGIVLINPRGDLSINQNFESDGGSKKSVGSPSDKGENPNPPKRMKKLTTEQLAERYRLVVDTRADKVFYNKVEIPVGGDVGLARKCFNALFVLAKNPKKPMTPGAIKTFIEKYGLDSKPGELEPREIHYGVRSVLRNIFNDPKMEKEINGLFRKRMRGYVTLEISEGDVCAIGLADDYPEEEEDPEG